MQRGLRFFLSRLCVRDKGVEVVRERESPVVGPVGNDEGLYCEMGDGRWEMGVHAGATVGEILMVLVILAGEVSGHSDLSTTAT